VIENFWLNALYSVTPTAMMGVLFWFIIRSILRADRSERSIYKKWSERNAPGAGCPVRTKVTSQAGTAPFL